VSKVTELLKSNAQLRENVERISKDKDQSKTENLNVSEYLNSKVDDGELEFERED
jgi:hypothetical protein